MSDHAIIFACTFIALYVGHYVGDFWLQTAWQAANKARTDWRGRFACASHATVLALTKVVVLIITIATTSLHVSVIAVVFALALDGISHYWADRRVTLAALARLMKKSDFYRLGTPRPDRDDNPVLGTGAHALDQGWHITWLWITALIVAIG